jgi:hypothetical protein
VLSVDGPNGDLVEYGDARAFTLQERDACEGFCNECWLLAWISQSSRAELCCAWRGLYKVKEGKTVKTKEDPYTVGSGFGERRMSTALPSAPSSANARISADWGAAVVVKHGVTERVPMFQFKTATQRR